jgi:four helix bundle protein
VGNKGVEDLIIWQLGDKIRIEVIRLTSRGRPSRDFKFRDQIQDAASGIPTKIAEGYGRATHAEFARFLDFARGSLMEVEDWTRDGVLRGYWTEADVEELRRLFRRLTPAISRFIHYLRNNP